MNPVDRTWRWWTNLLDIPFWDPWIATLCVAILVYLVVVIIHKLLRP